MAALAAGMSPAQAMPAGSIQPMAGAAGKPQLVQYWGGGWGPRYDEPRFEPRYREPRYLDPEPESDAIHPGEAVSISRSMGYRATTRPRLVQGAWVIDSIDRQGLRVRVSIDAFSGRPLRVRYIDPQGPRFGTPPVWPDERPNFQSRDGRQPMPRDGRLEQDFDRPQPRPERPQRAAKPERDITARLVPVPTPRPQIDPPGMVPPAALPPVALPPADATPAAPPPAARVAPQDQPPLSLEPRIPFTPPAAPPVQEAAPPAAVVPAPPPTAALPPAPAPEPPVVTPMPEVAPPAPQAAPAEAPTPVPPSAALPPAPVEPPPPPVVTPAPTMPAPVEAAPAVPQAIPPATAARPAEPEEGVMVDGRFLGPNGETLPGAPEPRSGVRQVTPQSQPSN